MYSRNITQFFRHLCNTKDGAPDFEDKITKDSCVTYKGKIVNEIVKKALQKKGSHTHD